MGILRMAATLFAIISAVAAETTAHHWSYLHNGASEWHIDYPQCGGQKQSPIDIRTTDTSDVEFSPFEFDEGWNQAGADSVLSNNGHTAQVTLDSTKSYQVSGGGLSGTYEAVQFHFHWGSTDNKGSEHTVDGKAFPIEMHVVHLKTGMTTGEAIASSDGIAVLGFLFELGDANEELVSISDELDQVTNPGTEVGVTGVSLYDVISPALGGSFYRYEGSLTTPGCNEAVVWSVFDTPLTISAEQLAKFRTLKQEDYGRWVPLVDNYRPVQPLKDRTVYSAE